MALLKPGDPPATHIIFHSGPNNLSAFSHYGLAQLLAVLCSWAALMPALAQLASLLLFLGLVTSPSGVASICMATSQLTFG